MCYEKALKSKVGFLNFEEKKFLRAHKFNSIDDLMKVLPLIYILPKIHKPYKISSRPIVAATKWITKPISRILAFKLNNIVKALP